MSRENSGPAKPQRRIEKLPARALSAEDSRDVRGGKTSSRFFGNCCQGQHYKKATLYL